MSEIWQFYYAGIWDFTVSSFVIGCAFVLLLLSTVDGNRRRWNWSAAMRKTDVVGGPSEGGWWWLRRVQSFTWSLVSRCGESCKGSKIRCYAKLSSFEHQLTFYLKSRRRTELVLTGKWVRDTVTRHRWRGGVRSQRLTWWHKQRRQRTRKSRAGIGVAHHSCSSGI